MMVTEEVREVKGALRRGIRANEEFPCSKAD